MFAHPHRIAFWASLLWALAGATSARAVPAIAAISPRGLQSTQPTTLEISGSDLAGDPTLICEAAIQKQTVKSGATAARLQVEVTLDPKTPPGLYTLRVATASGVSSPVMIAVDQLPERSFQNTIAELPAAYSGNVGAAQVLQAKLTGKKGQRIVLDVEAQRIGSGLKPVLRLNDSRGTQIAWSPPRFIIGGDARIETTLPADGEYTVEVQDELFRPMGSGFFRLKIGELQYADLAMPFGVTLGQKQSFEFLSSNIEARSDLEALSLRAPGEATAMLPLAAGVTAAAPRIAVSDFPELTETAIVSGGELQELPGAPVAVSGRLLSAGQEDKYWLKVAPKQKLRFDVVARQFGSPLDGVLTIRKEDGAQLAMGDDRPGSSDPLVDFTVPAGVNKVQIALKDLLDRGGAEYVYRLVVRDTSLPDFSLSLATDKINVTAGGSQVIPVQVTRMNYNGPIELSLDPQPSEISVSGNLIPAGATIGLLTLTAQDISPTAALTQLVGRATEAKPPVVRMASGPDVPGARYQPRVRSQLGLGIARRSPISLAWLPGDNDLLYLGGKMPVKIDLSRAAGTPGKVRLKLVSSQPTPKKTVKEGMVDKTVDDVERTLRLEGDPTFGPDQKAATANVLVPSDLAKQPWDLVLVAELLSPDGKNVVSSIATPARTLTTAAPFTLALTGENSAEGKAGLGGPGKLTGKIERSPGYSQAVVVTLDNLPKGYVAPQLLVPADKSEFALPLSFASSSKPGELKGAKLVAFAAPIVAKSVKSNAIDVSINVVAGEKPDPEQPKEVFEDDEKFIAMLTEGGGRAIPDQRDQYSGTYSLRVTPDQKFNAKLPNLGVKIRENPGPGEYRYVQFAWKKAQGNSICLQLAHDGKFGPESGSGREGAKFRYHAGPADECYGASLQVSDKIPAKFEVVTRDLFIDFGEFTLTGLGFSPVDGQAALFDHIYLARHPEDFELAAAKKANNGN